MSFRAVLLLGLGYVVLVLIIGFSTPKAHAYPGDPMPGCESTLFATYCDGPVRPDATFQRCWTTIGQWTNYGGFGGGRYCNMVDLKGPWPVIPVGAPQHHIDQ